jgi:hypothetical protein
LLRLTHFQQSYSGLVKIETHCNIGTAGAPFCTKQVIETKVITEDLKMLVIENTT